MFSLFVARCERDSNYANIFGVLFRVKSANKSGSSNVLSTKRQKWNECFNIYDSIFKRMKPFVSNQNEFEKKGKEKYANCVLFDSKSIKQTINAFLLSTKTKAFLFLYVYVGIETLRYQSIFFCLS